MKTLYIRRGWEVEESDQTEAANDEKFVNNCSYFPAGRNFSIFRTDPPISRAPVFYSEQINWLLEQIVFFQPRKDKANRPDTILWEKIEQIIKSDFL